MSREQILVVDDEEDILELVRFNLSKEGYQVLCAATGEKAVEIARAELPDLMVLDLMLPGMDGLEVTKFLKNNPETQHIPIVMLTAKGEESDVVTGLELGADDYVTKPFSPRILLARVKAVLRRKATESTDGSEVVKIHNLVIHPGRREVRVDGKPVDLTFAEFGILRYLVRRPGWVFTRSQIVDAVRGTDYFVTDRSVDVQIVGLRKKLGSAGKYSKIEQESEKEGVSLVESRMNEILQNASQVCHVRAADKEIKIAIFCAEAIVAKVDPSVLEQAIMNLLDNAIKYSDEGGTIKIEATQGEASVVIAVSDQGCGISKEHLPVFSSASIAWTRQEAGNWGGPVWDWPL